MPIISTTLFETPTVSIYKIPTGKVSLSNWALDESTLLWKGTLKLIEQEVIEDSQEELAAGSSEIIWETGASAAAAYSKDKNADPKDKNADSKDRKDTAGLRAKIELSNVWTIPPMVGSLTSISKDFTWAEIWYNQGKVGNNGEETVVMSESKRVYRVLAQLPGSGYHQKELKPQGNSLKVQSKGLKDTKSESSELLKHQDTTADSPIQVALALEFPDSYNASSFSEALGLYKRRYLSFQEQDLDSGLAQDDSESEDFDDFVSSKAGVL